MKEKITNHYIVETIIHFEEATAYFLDNSLQEERLELYKERMGSENLGSLAEAKHNILKQVFSNYVYNSLNNANTANNQQRSQEAKIYIENLLKLRNIFKSHDVLNYKEFISESEPEISEVEVNLLFLEPILNNEELTSLNKAFVSAFGKKHKAIDSKVDFQREFYNHPLINCLDVHSDYNSIAKRVENGTLELGKYKDLIQTIFKLKAEITNEEYQGFLFYVIKEDLTVGLKNILNIESYSPTYLKDLLESITKGEDITDKMVVNLVTQIKEQHTVNFSINSEKKLTQNKSSKFSLNDSGFFVNINDKELFFHAHETSTSGVNQEEQQANTASIVRNFGYDSLGITVLDHNVTRTDHHKTFVRENKLHESLFLNKFEEVIITGLQFDAATLKSISTKEITIEELKKSDLLMSNPFIVKSDIARSVDLINEINGKNDFELLLEKKNSYLEIFEKNKDFFKNNMELTSTRNEMSYQLLSSPFIMFVEAVLKIEKKSKLEIFNANDLQTIGFILTAKTLNTDLQDRIENCVDRLEHRKTNDYDKVNDKFDSIIALAKKELVSNIYTNEKEEKTEESIRFSYLSKQLKSGRLQPNLKDMLTLLDSVDLNSPEVSKQGRTALKKNLAQSIYDLSEQVLSQNYYVNKTDWMLMGINFSLDKAIAGETISFKKSSYSENVNSTQEKNMSILLSTLLKESNKNEQQRSDDLKLLNVLVTYAEKCNTTVICSNKIFKRDILKP